MAHDNLVKGAALAWLLLGAPVFAQSAVSVPAELADVAGGWAALAKGDLVNAATAANAVLSRDPRNVAAATLLVQTDILRGGAAAGLSSYEQWLANRPAEDPYILRVVARGFLHEAARDPEASTIKQDAFLALAADGDITALEDLGRAASRGSSVEMQVLGALGSEPMVRSLIAALRASLGDRSRAIAALVATHSPLAVAPLIEVLSDSNAANRAAAADGLGKLGDTQAVTALRPLLDDKNFEVHFTTARALYLLHDTSGLSFLNELQATDQPMLRAAALEATDVDVDQRWISEVRDLLSDNDPQVRLVAARLIAPYDPAAANAAFQGLLTDSNIAIRESAGQTYVDKIVTDLPSLRRFLRSSDGLTRVRAAARVLELCR